MTTTAYLAYLLATILILMTPGPTVLLVISHSLAGGRRAGMACVPGVALGDLTTMTLSFAGLGAVLALSATLFLVLKIFGAAYLIWMGLRLWRQGPSLNLCNPQAPRAALARQAWIVTATNPKAIAFFVAFAPQFLNPAAPHLPQFLLMGSTFLVLAVLNIMLYAWLAARLRERFAGPRALRLFGRAGACALMAAGLMTACLRRAN